MVFSQSASGLKRAISITVDFFQNINLTVNMDKTQVMIFNSRGLLLRDGLYQVLSNYTIAILYQMKNRQNYTICYTNTLPDENS